MSRECVVCPCLRNEETKRQLFSLYIYISLFNSLRTLITKSTMLNGHNVEWRGLVRAFFSSQRSTYLSPLVHAAIFSFRACSRCSANASRLIASTPLHAELFDSVLNLLPTAAERNDLGTLLEDGAVLRLPTRAVYHLLVNGDEIAPRHVLATHGDLLGVRVDVADLEHVTHITAAEKALDPFWSSLLARDEALGSKDVRSRVEVAGEHVDGDDVRGLVVPGTE
ncbi:hypothetical protein KC347_g256 [Hortaea werneckii]|nr:hypothetical protein KC347_g256 [Hortaea werneckii]